jgi:hypothetical protein
LRNRMQIDEIFQAAFLNTRSSWEIGDLFPMLGWDRPGTLVNVMMWLGVVPKNLWINSWSQNSWTYRVRLPWLLTVQHFFHRQKFAWEMCTTHINSIIVFMGFRIPGFCFSFFGEPLTIPASCSNIVE